MTAIDTDADRVARELAEPAERARDLAERLGLDPYPVKYWIVDYDEMNQLIAYEGFQERYPHWRWGMQYDRQRKVDQYGAGKAFEVVNNDNPAHAFLQESNPLSDQKAVITHVLAHADFFKHNDWFESRGTEETGATAMIARNAHRIRRYVDDPDLDREEVERWIDNVLSIADTIDQHRSTSSVRDRAHPSREHETDRQDLIESLHELGLREEVREAVFAEEWLDRQSAREGRESTPDGDVLAFLQQHGKQYDRDAGRAVEMDEWQRDVIDMLRAEAYYFAPQRMTKVMNEGWGAYYESIMMAAEGFADPDEVVEYADHMSKVLGSRGFNPYTLGKALWEYIENTANRREVLERLLQVEGVSWESLPDAVDFDVVTAELEPPAALERISRDTLEEVAELDEHLVDAEQLARARAGDLDVDRYPWAVLTYEGLAWRNYSLLRPQHRGFLTRFDTTELERIDRYLDRSTTFDSVEDAMASVDHTAGWERIREVRKSHNDVTFIDEFLTEEFVEESEYFTYEFSYPDGRFRVASSEYEAVKQKLLLLLTNFGKPRITVQDGNYKNRNELLLAHQYNGIMLDLPAAQRTLERVFELWGRPVNLKTILKPVDAPGNDNESGEPRALGDGERGVVLRYDGEEHERIDVPWQEVADIAADGVDYDARPEEFSR